MDPNERNKRDLPEVVADILITLDKVQEEQQLMRQEQQLMRQEQQLLREQMNDGFNRMEHAFNSMTTAVLSAMDRQTTRYDATAGTQQQQEQEVIDLKRRVEALEKQVFNKAS